MTKQEKVRRLLSEVSVGLTALNEAILRARAAHPASFTTGPLARMGAHVPPLTQDLKTLAQIWLPVLPTSRPTVVPQPAPGMAIEPTLHAGQTPEERSAPAPDVSSVPESTAVAPMAEPAVAGPAVEPAAELAAEPETDASPQPPEPHDSPVVRDAPAFPPVLETPMPSVDDPLSNREDAPSDDPVPIAPQATPPVTVANDADASPPDPVVVPDVGPARPDQEPAPVLPLVLQGDLAPFEPEHDRPQDADAVVHRPVFPEALDTTPSMETVGDGLAVDQTHPDEPSRAALPAPEAVVEDLPRETLAPSSHVVQTLPILPLPVGPVVEPVAEALDSLDADDEIDEDGIEDAVDDIQEEVLPIFFDEAPSLIEGITLCFDLIRKNQATFQKDGRDTDVVRELHRLLHTLKGNTGMVGALRARTLIHVMEGMMEEAEAGRLNVASVVNDLEQRLDRVMLLIDALERREFNYQLPRKRKPMAPPDGSAVPVTTAGPVLVDGNAVPTAPVGTPAVTLEPVAAARKSVRVNPELLDRLVNEANEAKLTRSGLESTVSMLQAHARDLDENVQGLIKMLRELEIHAESQIQSRRSQIEETGEEFDPLEFDRFTRLQELARFLSERAHDTLDLQQGVSRAVAEQETLLAYQERSVNEIQESLTKTRLTPFDDTTGPLVKMTKLAAREEGKEVDVVVVGGRTELDRALLEKINSPLQHALRNAVVHGIEPRDVRATLGKPLKGEITITVRQEAGRVFITIQDDGGGIRVDKVHQKAIERGLWPASAPMSDQEAADMVCAPHFSTVDTVSQLAGRGVGMDVVRSDVLALGGRFDLKSSPGRGLAVALQLPTTLSTAATLIVEAQGERVAIPVECIEHVLSMKRAEVLLARERGWVEVRLQDDPPHRVDFRYLPAIMGLKVTLLDPPAYNQVVVVRESDTVVAVLVDRLIGAQEVPIRPIGRALSRLPGIVGTTVLSDGHAAFVIDPARTRAAFIKQTAGKVSTGTDLEASLTIVEAQETQELPGEPTAVHAGAHRGPPLVMVVDDSLTVRKASARFLQREGYAHVLAKDGQEAVEMLATVTPDLILLDVEMPRMDGFDFAKHVREHPRHQGVPIIMITSRIADKHRKRADAIGVNGYLGKPFKEEELLDLLHQYTGHAA